MSKKQNRFKMRKLFLIAFAAIFFAIITYFNENSWQETTVNSTIDKNVAISNLDTLEVKGRSPKTNYERSQFGNGWSTNDDGCDTRNKILKRDLSETTQNDKCQILTGKLTDPYSSKEIIFSRANNSSAIQIDHVVALSDAWQKGAQQLSYEKRVELANDPLNLLSVDGPTNQQKGDGDAATWLPPNKSFRCQYIDRQISVKKRYGLWVTDAEKSAMNQILQNC
jgi:hypothetical protein